MAPKTVTELAIGRECSKIAVIQILGSYAYYGERVVPFDQEKTLVHELLHLSVHAIANTNESDDIQETGSSHQLIDVLARALDGDAEKERKCQKTRMSKIGYFSARSAERRLQCRSWQASTRRQSVTLNTHGAMSARKRRNKYRLTLDTIP
jgi:hypothetical protein